ncbi:MAG TPA: hypothetical protein ENJ87_06700, partial [Gammaproteobacteria bacterium]|nr:hypothetical protein [Gammaproteobacteria bacterium]
MKKITFRQTLRRLAVYSLFSATVIPAMWVAGINDAEAVPAFARKYDMTCNVCHTRQPRLNPFGQRFLENGYQLPGTSDGGTKEKHLLGGELNGATLDDISNYMAVRLRADVQQASFKDNSVIGEANDDPDIIFPNVVNIFFAGTATKDIGFFFETEYATQGGEDPALRFERSYLSFNNVGGRQVANIKVGNFDPSAMYSFPTHRQMINPVPPVAETNAFPPNIGRVPLLPLAFASKMFGLTRGPSRSNGVLRTGVTPAGNTTYDPEGTDGFSILPFEPMFFNAPAQRGISVHGRPFGNSFLYQVGVVQSETAEDVPETTFDPYIMLRYDILGKYSNFQVSGFYYTASKAARATLRPPGPQTPFNGEVLFAKKASDWDRMGLAARWQYKSLDIYGTYIIDKIDKPDFGNPVLN